MIKSTFIKKIITYHDIKELKRKGLIVALKRKFIKHLIGLPLYVKLVLQHLLLFFKSSQLVERERESFDLVQDSRLH